MSGIKPDPELQRRQAALFISGIDTGKLDGIPGTATDRAYNEFAKRMGIDPKDKAAINAALDAKIADPEVRDRFVRLIASTPKPSREDITALQCCLKEDGKNMSRSTTTAGLMDGVPGDETNAAMRESRRRPPSVSEWNRYVSPENQALFQAGGALAGRFHNAADGQQVAAAPAQPAPTVERTPSVVAQWLTPGAKQQ